MGPYCLNLLTFLKFYNFPCFLFVVFPIFLWLLVVKSLILRGFNFGVGLAFDRKDYFLEEGLGHTYAQHY